MATLLASLAGKYRSIVDNPEPLSWFNSVDLDVWHEDSPDSGQPDRWLVRFNDRKYAEAPVGPLMLSDAGNGRVRFAVEGGLQHWIVRGRVGVHGEAFPDDSGTMALKMRLEGQGMTGLETWHVNLRRATDEQDETTTRACEGNPVYDELVERISRDYSAPNSRPRKPHINALTIVKNGKTLFEKYLSGMTSATPHLISSCTKSITSLLAGIALHQNLFSLDDRVVDHFPDVSSTWGEDSPTLVRHVLSMTAGTEHTPGVAMDLLESTDVEQLVLGLQRVAEPGARYHYDNGLPSLIGCLIERRSGMSLEDFAEKYLFGPLDIKDYVWTRMRKPSRRGVTESPVLAAGGMFMSLPSFVKIGQMLLQDGVYNGRGIVPKSYISVATTQQTPPSDYPYGFFFHLNKLGGVDKGPGKGQHIDGMDGYFALGQGQQVLFVAPEAGLVVAGFSSTWHEEVASLPASWVIFDCVKDAIVEILK